MSDLDSLRGLVRGATGALERSRQRIDDLNVYPVPDGDTGTNMLFTVRGIDEALERTTTTDRAALAHEVTRAALLSARGNSGVILSQIVRGAAECLADEADPIDPPAIARAVRAASDAAYGAVREPVEGTILTVIRELAQAAEARAATADSAELLERLIDHGEAAVARTQEQLDVLRQAGVVDAGAAGLVELLRGITAAIRGEELPEPAPRVELPAAAVHQELSRFRYCTTFVIEGADLDNAQVERALDKLGDSLLVVGDPTALKAHVHTDDPDAALAVGTAVGTVDAVEIADMHRQTQEREERLSAHTAVVAVVAGEGNRRLFESLGAARIVEGGQTMNPPASDLVAAADATNAQEVVLLPNNSNVVLTAEQAATLAAGRVHVVPTRSIQEGLAALVAFNSELSAEENAEEMRRVLEGVATGEVTTATRDAEVDWLTVRQGEYLGLLNGRAVASGPSFAEVARAVADGLLEEPHDVLTLLAGEGAPQLNGLVDELSADHPELEIDLHEGGQPHYQLLLSAE